ncbi:chloride channel protein, partial [Thalassiosira pseudonana CCMP1335]
VRFSRKALAATVTLGTGNSLGPEGPSVEAGMSLNYEMTEVQRVNRKMARDRLLLACGAAAGVSAGFNAPLSGVFFALEIVQNAFQINISAILLASVVSALTIQLLLGSELSLRLGSFDFKNPLLELPLYLLLGAMSGVVAAIFSGVAQYSKTVFDGEEGPEIVQETFRQIPKYAKPLIASLICGVVGIYVPQVLFFGYETLNGLFLNNDISTPYLFLLLIAKLMTTAISASSGLVGGTFAPSLFLGGVLGAVFHNIYPIVHGISGLPAFAMVGAASVLAALFRAPLTASLLLFECTRNYDVILPLMASAGVA